MASATRSKTPCDVPENKLDLRQQLYNDEIVGPAGKIQLPTPSITRLHGILFDFDPKLILPENTVFPFAEDPCRFFEGIEPVLARHPLTRHAEVRKTGTGLHVIPRFVPAIELRTAADQQMYATLVRAIQYSLPADPNAPGITALTRAVGSVNSKNGATVEIFKPGEPIDPSAVAAFVKQLNKAPFRTVATILLGDERVLPCPICRGEGTRLDVLDHTGMCYARCGKVSLALLYDCVFKPFASVQKADEKGADRPDSKRRRLGKTKRSAAAKSSNK